MRLFVEPQAARDTRSFAAPIAIAITLAIAASSCGGVVATPGQGSAGVPDGSAGVPSADSGSPHLLSDNPICPHDLPAPPTWSSPGSPATGGTSCTGTAGCEYGVSSANLDCNTVIGCVTRRSSCNGIDDCKRSQDDRVWSVKSSPQAAKCQAGATPRDAGPLCPPSRPAVGSVCTENGLSCAYSCDWTTSACSDGYWVLGSSPPCGGHQSP